MAGLAALVLAVATAACGYALSGRANALPAHIVRIGVPTFTNLSDTPELDRILSEAVRLEFQSKRRYTVVTDSTGVDGLLTVSLRPVGINVAAFTDTRQAQRYLITVTANIEFKDVRNNKVIWSNPSFQVSEDYELPTGATATPAAAFSQDQNALTRLSKNFARTLVSSILEAF